jgi:hypothetical protein
MGALSLAPSQKQPTFRFSFQVSRSMGFWSRNLDDTGRLVRILGGIVLLAAAVVLYLEEVSVWPWIAGGMGLFMVFEGVRGWCVVRACKIKTPL